MQSFFSRKPTTVGKLYIGLIIDNILFTIRNGAECLHMTNYVTMLVNIALGYSLLPHKTYGLPITWRRFQANVQFWNDTQYHAFEMIAICPGPLFTKQ